MVHTDLSVRKQRGDAEASGQGGPGPLDEAGDVCSPRGFRAAGVHCGLKRRSPDLALLVSDGPTAAAGLFTTNRVQAAPVRYSRGVVRKGRARAVVVNSANANACTGERGERDAREMAELTARSLGCPPDEVLVASKHQSFLDIIMIVSVLPRPKFIMKKELLRAPFLGWYAQRMGCIPVDRGKRGAAVERMLKDVDAGRLQASRPV